MGVHHAGQRHVVHKGRLAKYLGREVDARRVAADDAVFAGRLDRCRAGGRPSEIDRARQRPVILSGRLAATGNRAVAHREVAAGLSEPPRRGRGTLRAPRRRPGAARRRRTGSTGCRRCSPRSGSESVSPVCSTMRSGDKSSSSAAIWRIAVSTPWPISTRPVEIRTVPGSGNRPTGRAAGWRRGAAAARAAVFIGRLRYASPRRRVRRRAGCDMAAAAADVVVKCPGDFGARRRRVMVEQRLGRDQDAGQAIAALAGLLVEKGLLQRVRPLWRAESLDGDDHPCRPWWRAPCRRISPGCRRPAPCSSRIARGRSRISCRRGQGGCAIRRAAACRDRH